MKYSQLFGAILCFALAAVCTLPWSYIADINITLSGTHGYVNATLDFGKQIVTHSFFGVIMFILFLIPKIWAKRINIFIAAINLALAIKNYILFTMCREGICPEKKAGIYLLLLVSILILAMTFFPKIKIAEKE